MSKEAIGGLLILIYMVGVPTSLAYKIAVLETNYNSVWLVDDKNIGTAIIAAIFWPIDILSEIFKVTISLFS